MGDKNAPLIFNGGFGGAGVFREFICLRRLMEDGIKPQRVGIEIVGAIMSHELIPAADEPHYLIRARRNELTDYINYSNSPSYFLGNWKESRWNPDYRFGMKMQYQTRAWRLIPIPWIWHLEKNPYDKWGWISVPDTTPENAYRANFETAKSQYANNFVDYQIAPKTDLALRRALELCKSAGVDVFLLKMPENDDFRALYTPRANAVLGTYLAKIEGEYDVPLIDASSWITKEGFSDGHHMNGAGGAEFTRRLADELLKTWKTHPAQ
jgi:hypothetical protein